MCEMYFFEFLKYDFLKYDFLKSLQTLIKPSLQLYNSLLAILEGLKEKKYISMVFYNFHDNLLFFYKNV